MTKTINIERAVIEVNGGCNYSCEMCPQTNPGRHKGFLKKMSLEMFEDIVKQCAERGVKIINLEGSGEPTLMRNLPEYIRIVRQYGAKADICSNAFRFKGQFMKDCIDAGLNRIRISVIGYDAEQYIKWMDRDAFELIKQNAREAIEYINETGADCFVASYHLILDNDNAEYEIEQYRKNFIDAVGTKAEIWKMHNWSGAYENPNSRKGGVCAPRNGCSSRRQLDAGIDLRNKRCGPVDRARQKLSVNYTASASRRRSRCW